MEKSARARLAGLTAKLLLNELAPRLKRAGLTPASSPVKPAALAFGVSCIDQGILSTHELRALLDEAFSAVDRKTSA